MSDLPCPAWVRDEDRTAIFDLIVCARAGSPNVMARIEALGVQVGEVLRLSASAWRCQIETRPSVIWRDWQALLTELDDVDVWVEPVRVAPYRLLICDMDMTIVAAETLDEVAASLGLGDQVAAITRRAMRGELEFDATLRERIALLAGCNEDAFSDLASKLELNPGAEALIQAAREHEVHTILISGGFSQVAEPLARQLGFDEVYCNQLVLQNGTLTGEVHEPVVNAERKRNLLMQRARELGIALADCCAIGDGANDRLMIEAAGLGIAYHAKPVLRAATACRIDCTDLVTAKHFMQLN